MGMTHENLSAKGRYEVREKKDRLESRWTHGPVTAREKIEPS